MPRSLRRRSFDMVVLACGCAYTVAAAAGETPSETLRAKVVAYSSASAFAVLDPAEKLKRVKLAGVDAPEQTQRFGPQARQLAAEYLSIRPIDISVDRIDPEQRVYGRVSVDGRDVGLALIDAGLAWCDPSDAPSLPDQVKQTYWRACEAARAKRLGLWQDSYPTPPWEHRKIPRFDPLPAADNAPKSCQEIGYQTLRCEDGKTYRVVGSQIVGSDGVTYSRRGNTVTGSDGNRYQQQGTTIYGTDGSACRTRGRRIDCF